MSPKPRIKVSVVILTFDGRHLIDACLDSLSNQSYEDFEVIVVDNGSTDGTQTHVETQYPELRLIRLDNNQGFAAGNNTGIREAQGEYIALLNNDAEAEPRWLEELVSVLDNHTEVDMCASKMLLYDDRMLADSCGDYYSTEGVPGKIGHLEMADKYSSPRRVFGACAGAAIYRRSLLENLGGFDEDFFLIHEDSDLNFRAQLIGCACQFVPGAIVYHRLSATIGMNSALAIFYAQRNLEYVFIKNLPSVLLVGYLPLHVIYNAYKLVDCIRQGQGRTFLKAKLDVLRNLRDLITKRREIQARRQVTWRHIDAILNKGRVLRMLQGAAQDWRGHPYGIPRG